MTPDQADFLKLHIAHLRELRRFLSESGWRVGWVRGAISGLIEVLEGWVGD